MDNKKLKLDSSVVKESPVDVQGEQIEKSKIPEHKEKPTIPKLETSKNIEPLPKNVKHDIKRKIFTKNTKLQNNTNQKRFKNTESNQCIKLDNDREISDERLRAYGSSMYKYQKQQKYKNKKQQKK